MTVTPGHAESADDEVSLGNVAPAHGGHAVLISYISALAALLTALAAVLGVLLR
jgi:hypothetical protein